LALDAFAELASRDVAPSLAIVGDGTLRPLLEARIADLGLQGRALLLGRVVKEHLLTLMRAADCLVLTSASEAMPLVVLEALASGVPVVSTKVGAVPEIVEHGVSGWLVQERSPAAISQGVRWIMDQPRSTLVDRASKAAAPYAANVVLERLYELHRELAAGRGSALEA
jgi:glycosyltransferase involved in cell wall biosynthesis